jgi:signal transduction histidine kinase
MAAPVELDTILEIVSFISSTLALDEILSRVTEKTAQVIGADSCAISAWDRLNDTVIVLADYIAPHVIIPADDINDIGAAYALANYPATARVLHEHIPLVIAPGGATVEQGEQELLKVFRWAAVLMTPLLYKGQAIGLMELYIDEGRTFHFTPDKIKLCQTLANQAAIAIENARLFAELERQRTALQQLSLRLVNAQEEERRRLARELHDELGQALTAIKINLDVVRRHLPAQAPAKLLRSLDEASRITIETQEQARNLSLALHPTLLDNLGLVAALRWELDHYTQRTDLAISFEADIEEAILSPELKLTLYRIISEALTNIARHAQASRVSVKLHRSDLEIGAIIEDNGLGFDAAAWFDSPSSQNRLGLISIKERTQLLGGQFQLASWPQIGTKIEVKFPITG